MLASGMMGRTVAAQGMMRRQMAQGMMGRQIVLCRGRGRRRRGFLCEGATCNAHGKRDRGDKGFDHGDIPLQEDESQPQDRVRRTA
jgi:hypothetical protein